MNAINKTLHLNGGGGSIPGIIFRSFIQVGQLKNLCLYFISLTLNETLKKENNVKFLLSVCKSVSSVLHLSDMTKKCVNTHFLFKGDVEICMCNNINHIIVFITPTKKKIRVRIYELIRIT